jgi:hypothetical protein
MSCAFFRDGLGIGRLVPVLVVGMSLFSFRGGLFSFPYRTIGELPLAKSGSWTISCLVPAILPTAKLEDLEPQAARRSFCRSCVEK